MVMQPILIGGEWRDASAEGSFQAEDPARGELLADEFPVSGWEDCDAALTAAVQAAAELALAPAEQIAGFLDSYAERIEARAGELVETAHRETALAIAPRLRDVELPRTSGQLRQAAAAARDGSWALPTIDTAAGIRSSYAPMGPVWVFGPNNFPFAFGSASGGDFAAAIAAGNPVIAKANTSHPATTRLCVEEAHRAAADAKMPPATVQLIYRTSHDFGRRLAADTRTGAIGYTGSRSAGLTLKAAADAAGIPIYLELSSVNPVVILPGALDQRADEIAEEFTTSCLMGTGQFCTNPGLVVLLAGAASDKFVKDVAARFDAAAVGTLLSSRVGRSLRAAVDGLISSGAELVTGGEAGGGTGCSFANTLLRATGERFLSAPGAMQDEAFGNCCLVVVARDLAEAAAVLASLEGNLTGCFYTDTRGADEPAYARLAPVLRQRVGRLLNDKMPTGVAVSAAMNHGGPYPSTGHPGFTAVGIPASLRRFAVLECYDQVRSNRLPRLLRDQNPTGATWRLIDGTWSQRDVAEAGT